jgi:Domain of unknown function (DUF4177)
VSSAPNKTPLPASSVLRSGTWRLAVECLLAGLVLIGVFWKNVAGLSGQQPPTARAEPMLWEYLTWTTDEAKLPSTLNKFGAHGWELVTIYRITRFETKQFEIDLVFKRPLQATNPSTNGPRLAGVWQLNKGDKGVVSELTLELTEHHIVKVTGKAGTPFVIEGTYERIADSLLIILRHDGHTESTQDKIKKLTATQLILENEDGSIEEYTRKSGDAAGSSSVSRPTQVSTEKTTKRVRIMPTFQQGTVMTTK